VISEEVCNRIHAQDCVEGLRQLPQASIDLAFADPPFNIGYEYDVYADNRNTSDYLAWSRKWMQAVHRVLKPTGTFWLAIGDEYAAELKVAAQEIGFTTRSWVIWYYTFGVNCKAKFSRSHAHLFYFVKDPHTFTFRAEELETRIPSARFLVYGDRRANPIGRLPDDTWILRPQDLADRFSPDEDTWYFPRVAGTFKERAGFHGCQMPEQLLGRIIRYCSNPDDVVLDPFSGSATTLAVAKKLGRRFLGFELSPEYVKRGNERLSRVCRGDQLDGTVEPTISAPSTVRPRNAPGASPYEEVLEASVAAWESRSKLSVMDGLLAAFQQIQDGFSVDRIVADPQLNALFEAACRKRGLPGDIHWWNRNLFAMRKAGKLSGLDFSKRTEFTWEHCDPFIHASELAWRRLIDGGAASLDEILCDPETAAKFDRIACGFVPGYSSLEYRWGALKLRKECHRARQRARALSTRNIHLPLPEPIPVRDAAASQTAEFPGVYLLASANSPQPLYIGQSINLGRRMRELLHQKVGSTWQHYGDELLVSYCRVEGSIGTLMAYQSLEVARRNPRLNIRELAAREFEPV
jgi:site-specific DNA-methyltransferase (adenine-specific)